MGNLRQSTVHNGGLSISCHCCCTGLVTTYKQDTGRGGRREVVSQLQQQHTLGVLCWLLPFLSSPASGSSVTAAHWPANSHKRVSTPDYRVIKSRASPHIPPPSNRLMVIIRPYWYHTDCIVAYTESLSYCATLGGAFNRDQLLMMSQSLITLLSPSL